eukprot:2627154-Pleurochrysis_carterae.AAC.1
MARRTQPRNGMKKTWRTGQTKCNVQLRIAKACTRDTQGWCARRLLLCTSGAESYRREVRNAWEMARSMCEIDRR